jgi:hypothetical protein
MDGCRGREYELGQQPNEQRCVKYELNQTIGRPKKKLALQAAQKGRERVCDN